MSTITPDTGEHRALDASTFGTRRGAAELDDVTGPMPVLDLADGHLHISIYRQVLIVEIHGGLDEALADTVVPAVTEALAEADSAILDLDQVTLLDRSALDAVCDALADLPGPTSRCIVAGRLSGRLVLERWHVPARFAVFNSVPDALQAREFVSQGYGHGWNPASP